MILLSFILALMLTISPIPWEDRLPDWFSGLRPEWTALVLLYWSLAVPERVGVGCGWLAGLFQDALLGTLLGQHALAFAVIAYFAIRLHKHLRMVPVWQQSLVVLGLLFLVQILLFWINGIIGRPSPDWQVWTSPIIGAFLWLALFPFMRNIRRRYNIQ
ncbi:rod shape-determining protein MreD [Halorhodospira halochloris]|uniref:rod shape-determining protein MreD n=1 Tax=Halorhodospira halochloris TaxID=1052 RepID=UPI00237941C3|nr:rod shape-determining protein MreD [Halorhodospira halochloris]